MLFILGLWREINWIVPLGAEEDLPEVTEDSLAESFCVQGLQGSGVTGVQRGPCVGKDGVVLDLERGVRVSGVQSLESL